MKMTAADYRKATKPKEDKRRVRGTKRRTVDGINFDSTAEARRYVALKQMEAAGLIRDLRLQVPFLLEGRDKPILTSTGRQMRYIADFVYWDVFFDKEVVEDVKGHANDVFPIKKAILAAQGIEITIVQ